MLLVGRQEGHPACKKLEWWGAGVVICLERGADLHIAHLIPLPLTVSCFSKIQIGFTFLVSAHPGSPRKRAVKRVCVCVCHSALLWTVNLIFDLSVTQCIRHRNRQTDTQQYVLLHLTVLDRLECNIFEHVDGLINVQHEGTVSHVT